LGELHTKHIHFEVAAFETSYHAILGRPALAKFMAVSNHTYLVFKMHALNGVLFIYGDVKTSHSCETENIDSAAALECSQNTILLANSVKNLPRSEVSIPDNISAGQPQL
jgi:hypothetical protein